MSLEAGTRLGPYEITALLGAGGMGEVYRATDTRLDRTVAIKVLPEHLADDPQRRERFEREAKAVSSLNHPHICTLHDIGEQDGVHYLVMEYVEGETLQQRLEKGRLPLDQALEYAIQIADALDKAHRQGVVHRDLKPGNIMITKSGTKLLDFGLAKLKGDAGQVSPLSQMPTQDPSAPLTAEGTIIGTLQYMAPEQLEGKEADARTDIFAFGAVVYEMVTGKKAFEGTSHASLMSAIMSAEPHPMAELQILTPPLVDHVVRRCLTKDPDDRWQTASDLTQEMRWVGETRTSADTTAPVTEPVPPLRAVPWILAALMSIVAVITLLWGLRLSEQDRPDPAILSVPLPADTHLAVDTDYPVLALSPDGSRIVFVGVERGTRRLYLRDLAEPDAIPIAGTEGADSPFFSPDGGWIGFFDGSVLKKVTSDGGAPVAAHVVSPFGVHRGATSVGNEAVVYAPSANSGLMQLSVAGETMRPFEEFTSFVTSPTAMYAWPEALPGGRELLFTDNTAGQLDDASVRLLSLETREIKLVVNGATGARYSPTEHVLYARGGSLYAVPFDPRSGATAGAEFKLLDGLMTEFNGAAQFSVAANGTLAYVEGTSEPIGQELVWVDREGNAAPLSDAGERFLGPRISPDGTQLAVSHPTGANFDIWVLDLVRGGFERRTTHSGEDGGPVWSPDGRRLALYSEIGEDSGELGPALAWITGSSNLHTQLLQTPGNGNWDFASDWSADGKWLAFTAVRSGITREIYLLDTDTLEPTPFHENPFGSEYGAIHQGYVGSKRRKLRRVGRWPLRNGPAKEPRHAHAHSRRAELA